ncbi:hypothetical protein N9145_02360 [bacterium]|nr:hypothetical protein [bacterium]MDB4528612.1 hypothetical protein [Pseudomonadales bacterium]
MAGAALVTAAGLATAASFGILLTALLYSPDINFQISAGETPTNKINPQDIGQRNFFGLAQAAPSIIVEDLPETKLELKLRGAFTAVDNANAGAIIEDDRKVAHHYAIGDEVPGDATLRAIYADRVVLARNGLLETLYFPDEIDTSGINTRRNINASDSGANSVDSEANKQRRDAIRDRIRQLRGRK